jgi:hypothetical protein
MDATNANRLALVTLALATLVAPIAWGAFRPVRVPTPTHSETVTAAPTPTPVVTTLDPVHVTAPAPKKVTAGHPKGKCTRREERRALATGGWVTAWWCELSHRGVQIRRSSGYN